MGFSSRLVGIGALPRPEYQDPLAEKGLLGVAWKGREAFVGAVWGAMGKWGAGAGRGAVGRCGPPPAAVWSASVL